MLTLSKPELKGLGYIWGGKNSTNRRSWLQFADDAVVISNSVKGCQALLNVFSAWCNWANMVIRLDKCCAFSMHKSEGVYSQTEPALFTNNGLIPSVPLGHTFRYLGKLYDFDLKNNLAKANIAQKLKDLLTITSNLKVKVQMKIKIVKQYILGQIRFELKTYNLGATWIDENLDAVLVKYVREARDANQ